MSRIKHNFFIVKKKNQRGLQNILTFNPLSVLFHFENVHLLNYFKLRRYCIFYTLYISFYFKWIFFFVRFLFYFL